MRKLPDVIGQMDNDIRALLEHAGLVVGRVQQGLMLSIDRGDQRVWYDLGYTTRIAGDASDPNNELFYDVIELVEGLEARQRAEAAWK